MEKFKQKINVKIAGIKPLLQNDSFEVEAGIKTIKGHVYDPKEEAEKRLIKKGDVLCQKASHVEGSMIKSAAEFKVSGRKTYKELFKASIDVEPELIPHLKTDWTIDSKSVKIGQARVMRHRPRFDEWELEFQIINRDERIQPMVIKEILENAGANIGVGDYRPKYGLFDVIKFEVEK